ncbi:MAG: ComEC/Rec2 family competence protein, partial [Bacteroidia bacterium]
SVNMSPLNWSQVPLLRPLIALIIGMCVAKMGVPGWVGSVLLVGGLGMIVLNSLRKTKTLFEKTDGVLLLSAFAGCGLMLSAFSEAAIPDYVPQAKLVLVRINEDPVQKAKTVKLMTEVLAVKDSGGWTTYRGGAVVHLKRSPEAEKLNYGDEILIQALPEKIPPPRNEGEFDYANWLRQKGVTCRIMAGSGQWQLQQTDKGNSFKAAALGLRHWFSRALVRSGLKGDQLSVAQALLLGNDDQIDPGLLRAYSASGTLHVLSVSGMHVALLFAALSMLLAPLLRLRGGAFWLAGILLAALWGYALLTGASPSVLRAVTMLSFVVAGKPFRKNGHILNMLAAAAIVLLAADPQLLTDIGFQLSFLAVGGIVVLQPVFQQQWQPASRVMRWIWSMVSVTLVAQLVTFPLGLYYFGQFPVYFLLSNMIVIPISTLVMYGGILLLIVSPFQQISEWVALPLAWMLDVLNGAVRYTEFLPGAVLHTSRWTLPQLSLLYLLIATGLFWLWLRRPRLLIWSGTLCVLLLITVAADDAVRSSKHELIIASLPGATAIEIVQGNTHLLLADSALLRSPGLTDFHLQPGWRQKGLAPVQPIILYDSLQIRNPLVAVSGNWISAAEKIIYRVPRKCNWRKINAHCDILLLTQNTTVKLDNIIARTKPELIIADGSNSDKKIAKWKVICEKNKIQFRDVKNNGAVKIRAEKFRAEKESESDETQSGE